ARAEFIVAVDLSDEGREARILLAAPVTREELEEEFAGALRQRESGAWDEREQAGNTRRPVQVGALRLGGGPPVRGPAEAARAALLEGLRSLGLAALPWDDAARALRARLAFVRAGAPRPDEWPDVSDAALLASLDAWLGPWLDGVTRRAHLTRVPLAE